MKKKIIRVALVAAIAVAAGWSYNQSQNEMAMSDLALANVEALAGCEVSSNHSENIGYCASEVGGGGDHCMTTGSYNNPRCSR